MITTINEFKNRPRDIIITIPKSVKWSEYEEELKAAERGEILNYKVQYFPKTEIGNKCYICYNGFIIGYHKICGMSEKEFMCTTRNQAWTGKFVERTGRLHKIDPIPMAGFRGYRYVDDLF